MLVFRILGTVFVGISCILALLKNIHIFGGRNFSNDLAVAVSTLISWFWRAFVIVALWLI